MAGLGQGLYLAWDNANKRFKLLVYTEQMH